MIKAHTVVAAVAVALDGRGIPTHIKEAISNEIIRRLFPEPTLGNLLEAALKEPENNSRGYVVFASGMKMPNKVHGDLKSAVGEAKRIALMNKDQCLVAIPVKRVETITVERDYPLF